MVKRFLLGTAALFAPDDGGTGAAPASAPATQAAPQATQVATEQAAAPPETASQPQATQPGATETGNQKAATDAATETKTVPDILEDDAEPPPGEEKKDAGDGKADAPVEYTEFKLPDAFKPDEAALGDFKALASEMRLPQESAQRLVDLYAREVAKLAAEPARAWNDVKAAWQAEIKAAPEFQGNGLRDARRAIVGAFDAHPDGKAVRQALELTGAINHPAVFRFMSNWAAANSEQPLARGTHPPAATARTPGERVYGAS